MNRILLISLLSFLLITACGKKKSTDSAELTKKKTELAELKKQQEKLSSQIGQLEKDIARMDPAAAKAENAK